MLFMVFINNGFAYYPFRLQLALLIYKYFWGKKPKESPIPSHKEIDSV